MADSLKIDITPNSLHDNFGEDYHIRYATIGTEIESLPSDEFVSLTSYNYHGGKLFILAKGVENSFYGNVGTSFLSDALPQWLTKQATEVESPQSDEKLKANLITFLNSLVPEATKKINGIQLNNDLPSLIHTALKQKQQMGSEVWFACGAIITTTSTKNTAPFFVAQAGINLRLWDKMGKEIPTPETDVKHRWSSKSGINDNFLKITSGNTDNLSKILLYTKEFQQLSSLESPFSASQLKQVVNTVSKDKSNIGGFIEIQSVNFLTIFELLSQKEKDLLFILFSPQRKLISRYLLALLSNINTTTIENHEVSELEIILRNLKNRRFIKNYNENKIVFSVTAKEKLQEVFDKGFHEYTLRIAQNTIKSLRNPEILIPSIKFLGISEVQTAYHSACRILNILDVFLEMALSPCANLHQFLYNDLDSAFITQQWYNSAFLFGEDDIKKHTKKLIDPKSNSYLLETRPIYQPTKNAETTIAYQRLSPLVDTERERALYNNDEEIVFYDFADSKTSVVKKTLPQMSRINAITISQNGNTVLIGYYNNEIHVIDEIGDSTSTIPIPGKQIEFLKFLPDSDRFVFCVDEELLCLGSSSKNEIIYQCSIKDKTIKALEVDRDSGNIFLLTRRKKSDYVSYNSLTLFSGTSLDILKSYDFSPDINIRCILPGKNSGTIFIQTYEELLEWDFLAEKQITSYPINSTTFILSNDEQIIYFADRRFYINVFNKSSKNVIFRFRAHDNSITQLSSHNEKILFSIGDDQFIRKWDLENISDQMPCHDGPIKQIVSSPQQNFICTVGRDEFIRTWSAEPFQKQTESHSDKYYSTQQANVETIPEKDYLIEPSDKKIMIKQFSTMKTIFTLISPRPSQINAYSVSPNLRWLASISGNKSLCVFDLEIGKCEGFMISQNELTCLSWKNDEFIIAGDELGEIHLIKWLPKHN